MSQITGKLSKKTGLMMNFHNMSNCLSLLLLSVSTLVYTLGAFRNISLLLYFLCRWEHESVGQSLLHLAYSPAVDGYGISWITCYWHIIQHSGAWQMDCGKNRIRTTCKKQHPMFHHVKLLLSFCKTKGKTLFWLEFDLLLFM